MDEILIGEKKYISSKQAAKMTGYAKDYIGQLCREGRVPARLVGRSWYVLETAIQDHRFGAPNFQSKDSISAVPSAPVALAWTKESPRYEAFSEEPLSTNKINRLKENTAAITKGEIGVKTPVNLQNSWKEWFDRIGNAVGDAIEPVTSTTIAKSESEIEENIEEPVLERSQGEEINIPIHTIYQAPPEELLPHYRLNKARESTNYVEEPVVQEQVAEEGSVPIRVIKTIGIILAVLVASVAAIGGGYFDKITMSNKQFNIISGVVIYNK